MAQKLERIPLLFQQLVPLREDAILGLMAKFRADRSPDKVDLGVGVFRDLSGNTPVLDSVRRAERIVLGAQTTKSYVAPAGRGEFNEAVGELVLGVGHAALAANRVRVVQAPGGCGALRLGAELIKTARPEAIIHVSDPTWGNHAPLLGNCGLALATYPYYDAAAHRLRFAAMLETLERAAPGDVVLLHACCHNPTGADLESGQWRTLTDLLQRRRLLPFLDLAYQGFGEGLEADVAGLRLVTAALPEALVAVSFSKNLGVYRERLGALIFVGESPSQVDAMHTHVLQIARGIYSMPPDHAAAIAAQIFADPELRTQWITELEEMRRRIADMRALLATALNQRTHSAEFDFLRSQHGMFSQLGCSESVVARLRERHHIYMLGDSRMNLAGLMPDNVPYVADSIASVLHG
jgi:aspartate aminotransferase